MKHLPSVVDPGLLNASARRQLLTIFLCGPGEGTEAYKVRDDIKTVLEAKHRAIVYYGEDLDEEDKRKSSRDDLQTLEAKFAHQVDFTILMLLSPGAIAELGTFSMIENIRPRLFVVLPSMYYDSQSYIARGPLSLISSYSASNVIYYNPGDPSHLEKRLQYPIMLYQYVREIEGYTYLENARFQFFRNKFDRDAYLTYFEPLMARFISSITLACINILQSPTFPEIVRWLEMEPEKVSKGLSVLHKEKRIKKLQQALMFR